MTHGTHAGYNQHLRAGEEPCVHCRAGHSAYMTEWNLSRRIVTGFTRVIATPAERDAGRPEHLLRCDQCGQRITPSGLGVGAHRRTHTRKGTP
jgi:hypothetical protein